MTTWWNGQARPLRAGGPWGTCLTTPGSDGSLVPRSDACMVRASHAWHRVSSGAPMRSLVLTTAQFEQYVAACGEPAQARELPSAAPDMGRTAAAGERFRIDVLPGRLVDWTDQAFLLIHLERVQRNEGHQERLGIDGVVLRQRLASVAAYIACTEDQVAATLERMALAWPEDA